ncbi:MAG: hypothetical protein LBC79_00240 [Deltaproteobacteria bacterium]|jgi:hypothetical protein|nr:hypothetical protein [Deltaproteobacteria bacterium]
MDLRKIVLSLAQYQGQQKIHVYRMRHDILRKRAMRETAAVETGGIFGSRTEPADPRASAQRACTPVEYIPNLLIQRLRAKMLSVQKVYGICALSGKGDSNEARPLFPGYDVRRTLRRALRVFRQNWRYAAPDRSP